MKENSDIKHLLKQALQLLLQNKIESVQQSIASAKESRDGDSKSSAGDKHETARAMVQIEIDNLEHQLSRLLKSHSELVQLSTAPFVKEARTGSMVVTSVVNYYISSGIGKMELNGNFYYAISATSPIGALLLGKSAGDSIHFRGMEILIKELF